MTLNTLSDPQFTLDKETHTYSHKDYPDAEFQSVTTVVGDHFEIFDAPRIAENLVTNNPRYSGMTVEELMGKWNETSRLGTRIHEEIEIFIYEGKTPSEPKAKIGLNWLEQFKMKSDFEIFSEVMVYSMELKIAGTIDILAHDLRTGSYELIDWKSTKKIQTESYQGKVGTSPITRDIPDCNFNHYALQLSFYRYLLEEYYSIPVSNQMIAHLAEDRCHSIVTPYMKDHIHAMVNQKART